MGALMDLVVTAELVATVHTRYAFQGLADFHFFGSRRQPISPLLAYGPHPVGVQPEPLMTTPAQFSRVDVPLNYGYKQLVIGSAGAKENVGHPAWTMPHTGRKIPAPPEDLELSEAETTTKEFLMEHFAQRGVWTRAALLHRWRQGWAHRTGHEQPPGLQSLLRALCYTFREGRVRRDMAVFRNGMGSRDLSLWFKEPSQQEVSPPVGYRLGINISGPFLGGWVLRPNDPRTHSASVWWQTITHELPEAWKAGASGRSGQPVNQLQAGSPGEGFWTGRHQQQMEAAGPQQPGSATPQLPQAGAGHGVQGHAAGLQQQTGAGREGLDPPHVDGAGQAAAAEVAEAQEWRNDLQAAAIFEQVHSLHIMPPSPAFPMQLCDIQDAVIREMLASVQFFTSCTLRHGWFTATDWKKVRARLNTKTYMLLAAGQWFGGSASHHLPVHPMAEG
eukprot:jgi/Astpho2/7924/Aster-x1469